MSQKLEDGQWEFETTDGGRQLEYVKGNLQSAWLKNGELYCPRSLDASLKPLRRIATLDGRPVVGEEVIEAIRWEFEGCWGHQSNNLIAEILTKHLSPENREAGGEEREAHSCSIAAEALAALASAGIATPEKGYVKDRSASVGSDIKRLAAERDRLKARIAELEQSTLHHYRENATGDEWVFLPADNVDCHWGLRFRDKRSDLYHQDTIAANFTPHRPTRRADCAAAGGGERQRRFTADQRLATSVASCCSRVQHLREQRQV